VPIRRSIILYVEDDAQSRKLMSMLLRGRMKIEQVIIWEDSRDFAARIDTLDPKPTLILLDIQMKPIDGFAMLAHLRALPWTAGVPIVALTASVMNEEVRRLRDAGFDGCLAKPINLDLFPSLISAVLAGEQVWHIVD
jgi:CheY-like chemotaxis protein